MADSTTEIPQKIWKQFFDRLRDWYRGAVSIRWIQPEGTPREIALDAPFQTCVFEKKTACSDAMTIEFGMPDERSGQHQIIEPIRVVLRKSGESGRYKQLEILAETGKTEIIFSPGIDAALLEKLAA